MGYNDRYTIQSNIHHRTDSDLTNYALFAGGLDVTRPVLAQYDPFKSGFYRLFMIRKPLFMTNLFTQRFNNFKHVLEYGNTAVSGLGDIDVNTTQMTGGYVGRSVEIPTIANDNTTNFTVTVYEFNGLPMREMLWAWINGVMDTQTGLSHYFGLIEENIVKGDGHGLEKSLANETAEFIYVVTDQTGWNIEYACLLANCFPKNLSNDMFNSQAGQHELAQLQIQFSCVKYESPQINEVAKALLNKYRTLMTVMDFNCKFDALGSNLVTHNEPTGVSSLAPENKIVDYDPNTGQLIKYDSANSINNVKSYSNYYRTGNSGLAPTYMTNAVKQIEGGTKPLDGVVAGQGA